MYIDLTGPWQYRIGKSKTWYPATVPGCIHTDLQRNGAIPDPFYGSNELELEWIENSDFDYRKKFTITKEFLEHRYIELIADGLDTLATIRINGKKVAETENMFIGYRFAVTPFLTVGTNTLTISFKNPIEYLKAREGYPWFEQPNDPVGGVSGIRKMQCSFGWDWGPRLPTCGIYRAIGIQAGNHARISHMAIKQVHTSKKVLLHCSPETSGRKRKNAVWRSTVSLNGIVVDRSYSLELTVTHPELWWPNGSGPQPIYELTVELIENDVIVDTWTKKIGLRTITLDRRKDRWGEAFRFLVNGRPVYAKGANWIPAHSFPSSVTPAMYRDLIRSAAEAHFNMLRVWGGGIYEDESFYDLCDEYGIMVWHDFMFACSLYPQDERFMQSVSKEAQYQTRRLAHRTCMALWCGNNELEQWYKAIVASSANRKAYDRIFYNILPKTVKKYAPHISYWPSSPHNPEGYTKGFRNENGGDCHFWDVWHEKRPPETAQKYRFRFWSEFGMQAYCSVDTALQFTTPEQLNVFSPAMENHQKHPVGNVLIFQYIAQRYRFPKDYASLVYLSQVNQLYCIGLMVEHQRACMPRTMGSLYWQLNDCWPVFSWSSIDFGGQWRGLHYAARRFYAPALVTCRLIGNERVGKINRLVNTVSGVEIVTAYDGNKSEKATLSWDLFRIANGQMILHGEKSITLRPNEAKCSKQLNLEKQFARFGKNDLVLRVILKKNDEIISRNSTLFTAPRFIDLSKEKIVPRVNKIADRRFALVFTAKTFQHHLSFHLPGVNYRATDNFFDLFPGEVRSVTVFVEGERRLSVAWVKRNVEVMSVAGSY